MIWRAHGLGLLLFAAALSLLFWDLEQPALWLDEAASVVAAQRSWADLWTLLHGADAPLVPYYALLKLTTSTLTSFAPGLASSPELLFRLPSVVATALAAWALTVWLARRHSLVLALAATTALLTASGFSRYGQETRPYGFVLLAAVISTITWTAMIRTRRWPWIGLYALSVVFLISSHLLAGSLLVAHLLTALLVTPEPRLRTDPDTADPDTADLDTADLDKPDAEVPANSTDQDAPNNGTSDPDSTPKEPESTATEPLSGFRLRWSALARTVLGTALGLGLVAPFAWPASGHGVGPTKDAPVTWDHLLSAFVSLFTISPPTPFLGVGVVLLFTPLGLVQLLVKQYRFIACLAAAWAFVPPLVLLPVVLSRPNLIIGRYLVFVVPGWTILAGLGVLTVVQLVRRLSGRNRVFRAITGSVVTLALLTVMALGQVNSLTGVRTPGGHSEDIRPALAAADRPEYAQLPIVMTSLFSSLELSAYNRADESRLVGQHVLRDRISIWPVEDPDAAQQAGAYRRLVLLLRAPSPARCRERWPESVVDYVNHCMPGTFKGLGYRVETAEEAGHRWTFAVISRRAVPADRSSAPPAR